MAMTMEIDVRMSRPHTLVERARQLVPRFADRAAAAEQNRVVPEESIQEMQDAELFQALQPRQWGGHEVGLDVINDIQMTLAEGCMSSAWVFSVLAVEPFLLAQLDPRAAADVWGDDIKTLVSGTSAGGPGNIFTAVDGGFRLSGRWRFASGSAHARWTFLGGCALIGADGKATQYRILIPREDYEIVDTWRVTGLKATGSNDIVVNDAFIPAHRAIRQLDLFNCSGPGQAEFAAPIFKVPFGQLFAMSVSTPAIGALKAMLDGFVGYGAKRVARGIGPTAMDPVAQLVVAETTTMIDEVSTTIRKNSLELMDYAARSEVPPLAKRMAYKFQGSYAVERASNLANRMFKASGASGMYTDATSFGRIYADISAARQHVNNQFEPAGRNWGRVMLGGNEGDNPDMFL
jgi:3-hydroxy-9,10-secoandrosta-1,3,5(10)-triene-9,17-dione monooxygenase